MSAIATTLHPDRLRASLLEFWSGAVDIARTPKGLTVAMPTTDPEGWQMVIDLREPAPGFIQVSDSGRTLGRLATLGQNIETDAILAAVDRICRECKIARDGFELTAHPESATDALTLHVFAEGLAAIAHLEYLRDLAPRTQDVADVTLRRVFAERGLEVFPGKKLPAKTEREIRVDYFAQPRLPVAFQILRRQGRILPTMEQWGFRWNDIKKVTPALLPAMLYNPALQEIDPAGHAIGEEVCALFCAYDDTARIHEFLAAAG